MKYKKIHEFPMLRISQFLIVLGLLLALSVTGAEVGVSVSASGEQQLFARISEIPELLLKGKLTPAQVPNPHWRDDACQACHNGNPNTIPVKLNGPNVDQLCQFCHAVSFELIDGHPIGVKPETEMIARMPKSYRDAIDHRGGKLACVTCHDLPAQCLTERRKEKRRNSFFLRDGPFRTRTQQCFLCHDAKAYERLNPHEQLTKDGRIREATCLICHSEDLDNLREISGIENLDFYGENELKNLCTRCHSWVPHPGGAFSFKAEVAGEQHLGKPTEEALALMQKKASKSGLTLPLEPGTGKISCATCHNPHERGVVKNTKLEKDLDKRLRTENICLQCHLSGP
jgi:hypothetical protein